MYQREIDGHFKTTISAGIYKQSVSSAQTDIKQASSGMLWHSNTEGKGR